MCALVVLGPGCVCTGPQAPQQGLLCRARSGSSSRRHSGRGSVISALDFMLAKTVAGLQVLGAARASGFTLLLVSPAGSHNAEDSSCPWTVPAQGMGWHSTSACFLFLMAVLRFGSPLRCCSFFIEVQHSLTAILFIIVKSLFCGG